MIGTDYAFPVSGDEPRHGCEGLTKREYAAIQIAAGLAANGIPGSQHQPRNIADEAVQVADALLSRLSLG